MGFVEPPRAMNNPKKRDYLLPKGCKDLVDALNQQNQQPSPLPPVKCTVQLPAFVSLRYMAELAEQHPFAILVMMHKLRIPGGLTRSVRFADAQRILQMYGIWATPEGER